MMEGVVGGPVATTMRKWRLLDAGGGLGTQQYDTNFSVLLVLKIVADLSLRGGHFDKGGK